MTSHIPLKDLTPAQQGGPIHTRSFKGLYRNLRLLGAVALMVLFFGTAWIDWNGQQAVLWDLDSKQFHIFGATFWPQDFILLSAILIIAAFGLFFITVLAGRVWCGYTCPQTVWTDLYIWVERAFEGDRAARMRLDKGPWNLNKAWRKWNCRFRQPLCSLRAMAALPMAITKYCANASCRSLAPLLMWSGY